MIIATSSVSIVTCCEQSRVSEEASCLSAPGCGVQQNFAFCWLLGHFVADRVESVPWPQRCRFTLSRWQAWASTTLTVTDHQMWLYEGGFAPLYRGSFVGGGTSHLSRNVCVGSRSRFRRWSGESDCDENIEMVPSRHDRR